MAATARSNEAWERVLAAVEADAARAAALLVDDGLSGGDGALADSAAEQPGASAHEAIPADWRLPSTPEPPPLVLPDPADMPPIPEELRERIERLRDRIEALQKDLAAALAEVARSIPRQVRIPTQEPGPGYVDRRV